MARKKPTTRPEPPTGPMLHYEVTRIIKPLWAIVALLTGLGIMLWVLLP